MGHEVEYRSYAVKEKDIANRAQIEEDLNSYVSQATWQEGGSGLYKKIRWIESKVYFGSEEARAALEKRDRGDYDQLAVKYWEPSRETYALWLQAYQSLLRAYSDVLSLRKDQHQIGAREALKQAEYRLHTAQVNFKEVNKSSTLCWMVNIEYHI